MGYEQIVRVDAGFSFSQAGEEGLGVLIVLRGKKQEPPSSTPRIKKTIFLKSANDRAQTWHNPTDVNEALQRSLNDLQLDYGTLSLCQIFSPLPTHTPVPNPQLRKPAPGKINADLYISKRH